MGLMTPQLQARITVPMLSAIWMVQALAAGQLSGIEVRCRRKGRYVAADVEVAGSHRPSRVALVFTPDGAIARLAILKSGQQPPG